MPDLCGAWQPVPPSDQQHSPSGSLVANKVLLDAIALTVSPGPVSYSAQKPAALSKQLSPSPQQTDFLQVPEDRFAANSVSIAPQ